MRAITDVLRDGQWAGRRCYVVGSGPSTRGLDFGKLLAGELTIGTNEEYRWNPTVALARDVRWIAERRLQPEYLSCPSIKVYHKVHPHLVEPFEIPDSIYWIGSTRVRKECPWGTSLSTGLASQSHCGISALNLADVLGASPIYLLGFDCKADSAGRTHNHERYRKEWGTNPRRFRRWIADFEWASKLVRGKVLNLNPGSAIESFEKPMEFFEFVNPLRRWAKTNDVSV